MYETAVPKTWRADVQLIALAVTFGISWVVPNLVRAQNETEIASVGTGRIEYEKYCTPCHGPGGSPGSAVYRKTKQPIDLRTYAQRHGGQFPRGKWLAVVFGSPPVGLTPRSGRRFGAPTTPQVQKVTLRPATSSMISKTTSSWSKDVNGRGNPEASVHRLRARKEPIERRSVSQDAALRDRVIDGLRILPSSI